MKALYAVASLARSTNEVILKVVNVSHSPHDTQIDLHGAGLAVKSATATVLTSADPADENTLDQPEKVAPITRAADITTSKFRWTFPAHSVTILRLRLTSGVASRHPQERKALLAMFAEPVYNCVLAAHPSHHVLPTTHESRLSQDSCVPCD